MTAIRARLRSPLRWLSAIMGSLMLMFIASIVESPLLMLAIPVLAGVFLLAPAVGVYSHEETLHTRAGVRLEAHELGGEQPAQATETRFRLVLVNDDDVPAEDFRIRLLVPHSLVPPDARTRPLGSLLVGSFGTHWFLDSMLDATAITFRTAPRGTDRAIAFPPRSRNEVADLILPAQARPFDVMIDYQVSGGSVKAALERLHLRTDG
jgi:hypothetical protein